MALRRLRARIQPGRALRRERRFGGELIAVSTSEATAGYPPPARGESHWPPQLTVGLAVALQLLLPERVVAGPRWLLPALEALLLISLLLLRKQAR